MDPIGVGDRTPEFAWRARRRVDPARVPGPGRVGGRPPGRARPVGLRPRRERVERVRVVRRRTASFAPASVLARAHVGREEGRGRGHRSRASRWACWTTPTGRARAGCGATRPRTARPTSTSVARVPASAKRVQRARAYVTASHRYDLHVDDARVGFGPAFAYPDYQLYQTLDVTSAFAEAREHVVGLTAPLVRRRTGPARRARRRAAEADRGLHGRHVRRARQRPRLEGPARGMARAGRGPSRPRTSATAKASRWRRSTRARRQSAGRKRRLRRRRMDAGRGPRTASDGALDGPAARTGDRDRRAGARAGLGADARPRTRGGGLREGLRGPAARGLPRRPRGRRGRGQDRLPDAAGWFAGSLRAEHEDGLRVRAARRPRDVRALRLPWLPLRAGGLPRRSAGTRSHRPDRPLEPSPRAARVLRVERPDARRRLRARGPLDALRVAGALRGHAHARAGAVHATTRTRSPARPCARSASATSASAPCASSRSRR